MIRSISVRIPEDQYKHIQQMAHRISLERRTNVRFSDLVREALSKAFPMTGSTVISSQSKISANV